MSEQIAEIANNSTMTAGHTKERIKLIEIEVIKIKSVVGSGSLNGNGDWTLPGQRASRDQQHCPGAFPSTRIGLSTRPGPFPTGQS